MLDRKALAALGGLSERMVARSVGWTRSMCRIRARSRGYAAPAAAARRVFVNGDARSLRQDGGGWRVDTADGPLQARGRWWRWAWSTDVLRPLGYRVPMAVKRGYHQHFALERGAALTRPVADIDNGFVMTPMTLGLRLTTGAEFASRDAPPTPVQIGRNPRAGGTLVPLGAAVEAQPWMGCRPCMPDMRPVIGRRRTTRGYGCPSVTRIMVSRWAP